MIRTLGFFVIFLVSLNTYAAPVDCKSPTHAMDATRCEFHKIVTSRSNAEIERLRAAFVSQGYADNSGEFPNAVFIKGRSESDGTFTYSYLLSTDVYKSGEFKTIGAILSATTFPYDSGKPRVVTVDKVFTSELFK